MTSSSMAFQSGASSSSSSSSSPSIRPWNHDVFLSFRGEDVRRNFISHLYRALDQRGIKTYIDNNLERGEEISPALFKAIEGSMISIIVFSKNYAESRWCLDELLKILDCMETMNQIVLPVFYDIDPSEVRHQKGIFGESFDKLGDKLKDNTKMLKWKVALKRVADLSGFPLADFRDESKFIQKIIRWVDSRIVNQTPLSVATYPVGIESRIQDICDQHLNIGMNDIIRVVGIFGTGGIGKTTISKDIYNRISSQFEGSCFLRNIRETSKRAGGLLELQKTLLFKILGKISNIDDVDRAINVIRDRLSSKRILLVLDDVDEMVQLEKLAGDRDWFGSGSRILITTRDQHLLKVFEVDSKYEVMILNDEEALQLFRLHAFKKDEPLEEYMELSKQVTKYAQGLPLALKNLTTMTFVDCEFLEKIPDLSSISNLKELIAKYCTRLVEVHDSVGSLENLSRLDFEGCSKLHILPRSLNLRSLRCLRLRNCSSLRYLPEIECKMECLTRLFLDGTAIEELPLSIGNLVGLEF